MRQTSNKKTHTSTNSLNGLQDSSSPAFPFDLDCLVRQLAEFQHGQSTLNAESASAPNLQGIGVHSKIQAQNGKTKSVTCGPP